MPGGPINGVPWSAMAGLAPGGETIASAIRQNTDKGDQTYTGIIIPTVLQISQDMINYFTGLTCLYDPYWTADPDKVTLPICTFNVSKIVPSYHIETSNKRVILYEQQGNLETGEMANQMRENVMRTIIDNSVKMPTTYSMEIIFASALAAVQTGQTVASMADSSITPHQKRRGRQDWRL